MRLPSIDSATFEFVKAGIVAGVSAVLASLLTQLTNDPNMFGPYTAILVALLQAGRAVGNPSVKNY